MTTPTRQKKTSAPVAAESAALDAPKPKRVRLTPEVRRQQILDAALEEFGLQGFAATGLERIARRAGMSKANLYVHFKNKDEIFETLLRQVLVPQFNQWQPSQPGQGTNDLIDSYIDSSYDALTPHSVAVIRLVIAESHRIPDLIQRWHEESIMPFRAAQQQRLKDYVSEGKMRPNPLTEHFGFSMAPIFYAAVAQMIFRPEIAERELSKTKETHRQVLRELLVPEDEPPRLVTPPKSEPKNSGDDT